MLDWEPMGLQKSKIKTEPMTTPIEDTQPTLSKYKWKRLAAESLINALRLHRDAILLFNTGSYPSAYQLSVLCLEEFAKAKWIEDYYWTSVTNCGLPDAEFEQSWLKLLYVHSEKQYAFVARDMFEYPPALVEFIKSGKLERRKQQAVYVGLERDRKSAHVTSRISLPSAITLKEAKQLISWINSEFIFVHKKLMLQEVYFGISEMNEVMLSPAASVIFDWPHKSRTRSRKHQAAHHALHRKEYREAEQQYQARVAASLSKDKV
jgi:AbiV family abortive infection protein